MNITRKAMKLPKRRTGSSGFSLIELMIAVSVFVVLRRRTHVSSQISLSPRIPCGRRIIIRMSANA